MEVDDLSALSREELELEVLRLREGIRKHRDSSGHDLCWYHPELWSLLPEEADPAPAVPPRSEFLQRCAAYHASLSQPGESLLDPDEPRDSIEHRDGNLIFGLSLGPNETEWGWYFAFLPDGMGTRTLDQVEIEVLRRWCRPIDQQPPSEKYDELRKLFDPLIEARAPLVEKLLFNPPLTSEEQAQLQSFEVALDMVDTTGMLVEAERMNLNWCLRLAKAYRAKPIVEAISTHMRARKLTQEG